jgi:hypothetical protein
MNKITTKALELLVAISSIEKKALTEKLTAVIEKYRDNPEKSEELASLLVQTIESFQTETTAAPKEKDHATREDVGLLLLEISKLKQEIESLKNGGMNV